MRKILFFAVILSLLISAAATVRAENESVFEFSAPDYAGAVLIETIEDDKTDNVISLFSLPEESLQDYIYNKLMDETWYKDKNNHTIFTDDIFDDNKNKIGTQTVTYITIPLSGYSVTKDTLHTVLNYLVNEKGEILVKPQYRISSIGNKVSKLHIPFEYEIDTIESKRAEIKNKADAFIESLGDYELLTERERVLLTHDFIASNAYYAPSDINNPKYHTLYSAVIDGVTVCQGYTQAMCYILNQIGVDCVSCLHEKGNHVWNCVKVDGQWSHVDVTWDDTALRIQNTDDTFDYIRYNDCMTNAETMINNKRQGYSNYSGPLDKSEFTFPSGKLEYEDTEFESDQSNFAYNYLIHSVLNNSILFLPSGFAYENGRLVHTLKALSNGELFGSEYKFIYNGLIASNSAVSVPTKINGGYSFLALPLKDRIDLDDFGIYIAGYEGGNTSTIAKLEIDGGYGTPTGILLLKCLKNESLIANTNQAKFFFWNSNMRPYTQPTYNSIQ